MTDLAIVMQTALVGINTMQQYSPKLSEIRRANVVDDPAFAGDVRLGEIATAIVTVGIGILASSLTETSTPAIVSVFVAVGMIALYEIALRSNNLFEPK